MGGSAARYYIPLAVFAVLAGFLAIGLKLDPRHVPSPLIDKPAPDFSLPLLDRPEEGFSPDQFKGDVWVLNVWASWCVACREEHEVLKDLAKRNSVALVGLNYKDEVADARRWLHRLGDPYALSVVDADGQAGIDWGVYGVPETFVIDGHGIIRYKHIGPVSSEDLDRKILPLIEHLQRSAS